MHSAILVIIKSVPLVLYNSLFVLLLQHQENNSDWQAMNKSNRTCLISRLRFIFNDHVWHQMKTRLIMDKTNKVSYLRPYVKQEV